MRFVDDFIDYCRDFTACPEPFLRWAGIMAISAVAGRRHAYLTGDWNVYPNLWVLILGNSSSYKSTGIGSMVRLLREAWPDLLMAQQYSHEALFEELAHYEHGPHKLFYYDEAETFLRMMGTKYNAGMESTMLTLYNGTGVSRKIKGREGKGETHYIKDPYLTWVGASTPFQIASVLNGASTSFLSGFWPRYVIVPYFGPETSLRFPPPANKTKAQALIARLRDISRIGERQYTYAPEAAQLLNRWTDDFERRMDKADPMLGAFYKKMKDEQFHKICILSALERGSSLIEIQDLEFTIPLLWEIEREWPSLLERFTERQEDRDAKRVEDFIRQYGELDRTQLLRGVRGIRAQKMSAILDGLKQDNKIIITADYTPGRPKTTIKLASI